MKKKQIIGIIVAGIVFTATATVSSIVNYYYDSSKISTESLNTDIFSNDEDNLPSDDFVGIVNVKSTIIENDPTQESVFKVLPYDHNKTLKYIDNMEYSKSNKGILLVIDSPGGTVYASDELYLKLKEYKDITGRPIWTYMKSYACSGGYYIAMNSDKIFANRNTWTGSIGVIISTYNLTGLYDILGIKEINITSGANKAMGSAGEEMNDEQRAIYQGLVDEAYEQFTGIVAKGRNMDIDTVKKLADGRIYTAQQALDNGLIDDIDTYESVKRKMLAEVGDAEFYAPESQHVNISSLFGQAGLNQKSEAEIVMERLNNLESEVMYYAEPLKPLK